MSGGWPILDSTVITQKKRIIKLEEALLHLLEVQTAPSFHQGEDKALYETQRTEWREAVEDARRAHRNG